jgi:Putative adhesin
MTTFDTPEPISVRIELGVGDIRIDATDRPDTTVEVRPSDPAKKADVTAADRTRVGYANGRLDVVAPKGWRQWMPHRGGESIDVEIHLPSGSRLEVDAGVATMRCSGRLGPCRLKAGVGHVHVDEAGPMDVKTGAGDITVERAVDRAVIVTGSGAVRIAGVDGTAVVKNSNGDTWIGEVVGEARVSAANGPISIDVARAGVLAKTANGDVRLGEVARGAAVAQSAFGNLEVGVRDGVAAWLDLQTSFGTVRNDLDTSGSPREGEDSVEVHASTSYGDIAVHRSFESLTGKVAS